ncbi:tRNA (guanine-N(1)-)-methyltransferase, putative [Ixodes scapularis]|uniref:tRNA (Guanine-N(1)-)-methyltransferase, putative n=1 Tax=Ixodes scapularis TaxID=6945 RepID=B7PUI2_IXOSC|nr:tRNA (guanine-N(1)-)-methyltransferase, putative [Ixodes scapularis]|eukprot:XP_002406101.1 tRNA (guanine-N(1)-)-methyltransferase, putative [Ixodes scapularis]
MVSTRLGTFVATFLRIRITRRHPVNSHFQYRVIVPFFASPKMTSSVELPTSLHPPASVRGMTELKREAFDTVVDVPCFEADTKFVGIIMKHVREQLLKLPNFKPVRDASDGAKKLFLLDPCKVREYGDLSAEARDALGACGVGALASRDVTLSYANWTAEEVLRAVLGRPDASGFSVVGHILHLNLREHLEPYKALIGRVYLDKVKNVTCVVNKVNVIESTFRNFSMEVLAGEKNTQVEVKQNGLREYQGSYPARPSRETNEEGERQAARDAGSSTFLEDQAVKR